MLMTCRVSTPKLVLSLILSILLLLSLELFAAKQKQYKELGAVDWMRDYDAAMQTAAKSEKPVLILFQEVPGCQGCVSYGETTLSEPLIVDAIEHNFIPVAIFNNKPGRDAEILKHFKEPAWNFQVMRFLDDSGKDIIPRKDRVWTTQGTASRMIEALVTFGRPVPDYLKTMAWAGHDQKPEIEVFSMYCFWSGEANLGGIEGVVETESGWMNGKEVVKLSYDPKVLGKNALAKKASVFGYHREDYDPKKYRRASQSDQKRHLRHSKLKDLKLTRGQATKINAALAKNDASEVRAWLSPSQITLLTPDS